MDINVQGKINDLIGFLGAGWLLLIIFLIGTYLFWFWNRNREEEVNSILDLWFGSSILMVLYGRLMYVLANLDLYNLYGFSLAPYEKYGSEYYFFRLLPWSFLNFNDLGFLFTGMYFMLILCLVVWAMVIKKIRIRKIISSIMYCSNLMLGITLAIFGAQSSDSSLIVGGGMFIFLSAVIAFMIRAVRTLMYDSPKTAKRVVNYLRVTVVVGSGYLLWFVILSKDVVSYDRAHVYMTLGVLALIVFSYIFDLPRNSSGPATVEEVDPSDLPPGATKMNLMNKVSRIGSLRG